MLKPYLCTMSLKAQIDAAVIAAMKSKDSIKLRGLRDIKAQLLLAETSGKGDVTEEIELTILQKMAKQRQDSLKIYEDQNREDLAVIEREELALIQTYLPKPLSETELTSIIKAAISTSGAEGMKDMGKVMGIVKPEVGGGADGRTISEIIKKLLA
jgi:uncharacterized protein YqeY